MSEERVFELTVFERMLAYACQSGDFLVMGTTFIDSELSVKLDKELVRKALIIMQKRHPFFRAYLDMRRKENQIFLKINNEEVTDKIELEWLDLTHEGNITRSRINDESAEFNIKLFVLENKNLLWRLQVISYLENDKLKYVLNLVVHIVITDGINITTLGIELVNIINALMDNQECDEMKTVLEPTEDFYTLSKKCNLFKDEHLDAIKKFNSQPKSKFILPDKFKAYNETGFKLDLFKLDKELTANILSMSKFKKVRLTGYFYTCTLYALRNLYIENGLVFPKKVLVETPISLRVRYKPNLEFYHGRLHTTMVTFPTEENKFGDFKDFWQDAGYIHKLIQENSSTETGLLFTTTHDENLDEFNKVFSQTETNREACEILKNEVYSDLAVSNLGAFVNDRVKVYPGTFNINEIYCTDTLCSSPSITPAILIHLFYWRGEIMVQLGANKGSFGTPYIKSFKELLLETINSSLVQ